MNKKYTSAFCNLINYENYPNENVKGGYKADANRNVRLKSYRRTLPLKGGGHHSNLTKYANSKATWGVVLDPLDWVLGWQKTGL